MRINQNFSKNADVTERYKGILQLLKKELLAFVKTTANKFGLIFPIFFSYLLFLSSDKDKLDDIVFEDEDTSSFEKLITAAKSLARNAFMLLSRKSKSYEKFYGLLSASYTSSTPLVT